MTDTPAGAAVVHVVGRARAGDPVTTAARSLCRRLADAGRPGRLVSAAPTQVAGFEQADLSGLPDGEVLVHSIDGGYDLMDLVPALVDRRVRLLHHGSAQGSDRRALRTMRSTTTAAAAVEPAAREELRRLGFADVEAAPIDVFDDALADVPADAAASAHVESHPGPRIVVAGPVDPTRSLELVLDAFADLLTNHRPSATLSICGPAPAWYASMLRRQVLERGLMACELLQPDADSQLVARLDAATAVVALHPNGLAPYLRRAERAGATVVAPLDATTLRVGGARMVTLPARVSRQILVDAVAVATSEIAPTPAHLAAGRTEANATPSNEPSQPPGAGTGSERLAEGKTDLAVDALLRALQL